MKRIIRISALLLFATVFLASCLGDNDSEITYYSDAAIMSFSVTNFNTYHTTTASDGSDSVYRVKEDGTKYKFYIDQTRREIYNPDSLPLGTDAKHIICSISTVRGGNLYIKSAISDSLFYLVQSDSLDFSTERVVKVISLDGLYDRTYTIKVNVHKQLADQFVWNYVGASDIFKNSDDINLLSNGENLAAFVKKNALTEVYVSSVSAPGKWQKSGQTFEADDYHNVIVAENEYLLKSGDKIYSSADAMSWTEKSDASAKEIHSLAGSMGKTIYALAPNGIVKSEDKCRTWSADVLADSNTLLPYNDISFTTQSLITNAEVKRLILIGNTASPSKYASVWSRLIDSTSDCHEWNFVEQSNSERFRLPQLRALKVIPYAGGLYAVGAEAADGSVKAFDHVYYSKDGGINWLDDSRFKLPDGFACKQSFAITSDNKNNIWLICGDKGYIWRGRLNELSWENK